MGERERAPRPPCLSTGCAADVTFLGKGVSAGDWPCVKCGWTIRERYALIAEDRGTLW